MSPARNRSNSRLDDSLTENFSSSQAANTEVSTYTR